MLSALAPFQLFFHSFSFSFIFYFYMSPSSSSSGWCSVCVKYGCHIAWSKHLFNQVGWAAARGVDGAVVQSFFLYGVIWARQRAAASYPALPWEVWVRSVDGGGLVVVFCLCRWVMCQMSVSPAALQRAGARASRALRARACARAAAAASLLISFALLSFCHKLMVTGRRARASARAHERARMSHRHHEEGGANHRFGMSGGGWWHFTILHARTYEHHSAISSFNVYL